MEHKMAPFKKSIIQARDDIIAMQLWINSVDSESKLDPKIQNLIANLYQTRNTLESLL